MNEPDVNVLFTEIEELQSLINQSNQVLEQPQSVSHFASDYERALSKHAAKIGAQLSKVVSRGKIEEAVIGGAVLGAIWLGAKVVDVIADHTAKQNAKDSLLAYYKELMVKKSLIDQKRDEIVRQLEQNAVKAEGDYARLRKKYQELEFVLRRIEEFQAKVI